MTAPVVKGAVIGGSGLDRLAGAEVLSRRGSETPYGATSDDIVVVRFGGDRELAFLPRHGGERRLAPHQINYRANIWALADLGVNEIVAINAVGGLVPSLEPGQFVIPDQLLDYTWGREHSFNRRPDGRIQHIDFTHPYSPIVRSRLAAALGQLGLPHADGGVYACTQGPRLETAAEVLRLRRDGGDVVGMTGMPEAALARELGLDYAALCLVVNRAAGLDSEALSLEEIYRTLEQGMTEVHEVIAALYNQKG